MTLSSRNWLVRFAYIGADWGVPAQVSLCALFWRTVWRVIVAAVLLTLAGAYLYVWYREPLGLLFAHLATLSGIGLVLTFVWIVNTLRHRRRLIAYGELEPSIVSVAYHAFKNRFCPIITIDHGR